MRKSKWLKIAAEHQCDLVKIIDRFAAFRVKEFEDAHNINLNHWQETLNDYDETAGLVENLDLIISVPQSVVHLAGALGQAVWQLAPFRAMWQVGPYGEEMPWYLSATNFWQENDEKWEPVMDRVRNELCNLLAKSISN